MKRQFSILACLVLALVMVFALASCENPFDTPDQPDEPAHTHTFVEGKCECGETDPEYVAPECEHAYGYEVTTEPNCTDEGVKTFTCTLCGHSYTQSIAPLGHTEETVEGKAPTCTEPGLSNGKKCSVCGETITAQNEINATGHSFVEGACSACGEADPNYNGPKTYVFESGTLEKFAAGAKADGETELVGTDGFFKLIYSAKTKVDDTSNKQWEDGYAIGADKVNRLAWSASSYVNHAEEGTKNVVEIAVDGTATVKVWWICGGDGRQVAIYNADGTIYSQTEIESVKNTPYLAEFSIDAAGTYYIGNVGGANYFIKLAATVTPVEEAPKNEIKVETTDTYSWIDEYTFTADAEGYYTFNLPAGLGFAIKDKFDNNGAPEIDFYGNENGYAAVIGLEAGETLAFYVGAITKDVWTIEWTFEAGEVENGGEVPGPSVEIDTELELGTNSIYAPSGAFGSALECTFVVTEAGTYTFSSNYLMAVITIDELTTARGQAYLEPGTYVVNIVYYASSEGYYDIDIEFAAPVTGEPDGSEQFPFVWETLPESVTFVSDNSNKVYYVFTATADGSVTFTWAVEGNDWFDYFELVNGATTANNGSGFAKTSHTFVVEAGKTYRVGLGTWDEGGETVVNIAFAACNHVWSEATCSAPSTCANCGATTGDKAEHTSTVAEPDCAHPDVCGVCGEVIGYFDHTMDDGVVITPADCATGTDGSIKYTCTVCGHEETETLWAYHEWDYSQCVEATCTTDGKYHAVCTVCGEVESYDIEASGHYNWYATCGDTTTCMECGLEYTVEHDLFPADCFSPAQCSICWQTFGEPLPHNFVDGVCTECYAEAPHEHNWSNATCTEPAKCECGETNGEALGHDYDNIPHDATCTAAGYVEHICALCDHTYTDGETEALGHADDNGDYKCDRCSTNMLPADGTTLTIPEAIAVAKVAGTAYSTEKYYITGIIKSVYNTTYGNLYLVDADGNEITIYGLYSADGKTRYDAMSYKPVAGDELTVYTVLGLYNSTAQGKNAWMDDVVAHEHNYVDSVTDPTCTKAGYTTHSCTICGNYYTDSEVEALGHTTDNGECERCGLTIGGDVVNNETFTADFGTLTANTSYGSYKTTSGWQGTNCCVVQGGTSDNNPTFKVLGSTNATKGFVLNGKTSAKGKLVSPTLADGLSKITFNYANVYSESNGVDITITIKQDGVAVATKKLDNNSVTKLVAYTFEWDLAAEGVAVSGDFTIEITNNSPSNNTGNKDRVAIWNFEWTTNK